MAGTAEVAKRAGVDAELAYRFVDAMKEMVLEGHVVKLKGFGQLKPKLREARLVKTPLLREPVAKVATVAISFKAARTHGAPEEREEAAQKWVRQTEAGDAVGGGFSSMGTDQ